jgi:hypothetical protein
MYGGLRRQPNVLATRRQTRCMEGDIDTMHEEAESKAHACTPCADLSHNRVRLSRERETPLQVQENRTEYKRELKG